MALDIVISETKKDDNEYVFLAVYDDMMTGCKNHSLLENAYLLMQTAIPGYSLIDIGNRVAALKVRNPSSPLFCEVYKIKKDVFEKLKERYSDFEKDLITDSKNIYIYRIDIHIAFSKKTQNITWIKHGNYIKYIDDIVKNSNHVKSKNEIEED